MTRRAPDPRASFRIMSRRDRYDALARLGTSWQAIFLTARSRAGVEPLASGVAMRSLKSTAPGLPLAAFRTVTTSSRASHDHVMDADPNGAQLG
jgi:hypothetical protein